MATLRDIGKVNSILDELRGWMPQDVAQKYSGYHKLELDISTPEGDFFSIMNF